MKHDQQINSDYMQMKDIKIKEAMIEYDNRSPNFYFRWNDANKRTDLTEEDREILKRLKENFDKFIDGFIDERNEEMNE